MFLHDFKCTRSALIPVSIGHIPIISMFAVIEIVELGVESAQKD